MANESVFSSEPVIENDSDADVTLEVLVGENQKYKTPDELAKAYVHADNAIARLKAEKAEAEARAKVLEDLVKGQGKQPVEPNGNPDGNPTPPAVEPPAKIEDVDLKSLIQEELNKATTERQRADNINSAASKLAEVYGGAEKARAYVQKKAEELGVGVDFLMNTAGQSPKAFFNLVGFNEANPTSTPSPVNELRPNAGGNGKKGKSFYENIRKTNPTLYYSRPIQDELFAAVANNPDYFTT